MAFAYLTFAQAAAIVASRLQDPAQTYWNQPDELLNCAVESVRLFNVLTGSYKQKLTFPTAQDTNYYDLPALASAVSYNATDVEVVNNVLAALLEPPLTYPTWTGTGQFALVQLQAALQHRLNRFIGETGCRVTPQTIAGPPPPQDELTVLLPDGTLDVRRAAWVPVPQQTPPANPAWPLGRIDEWAAQAYVPDAPQAPGFPLSYSVFGVEPLQLRVVPPPLSSGNLDCLFVLAGPIVNLNPASPVVLQIPDDLSPALKWGVLADLLASDGPSRDYARAAYCEQRYKEFVQLAALYPSTLIADVNGITCGIGSVFDMDFYLPDWQQSSGAPSFVGMCGRNLACAGPTPDDGTAGGNPGGDYGIGLWTAANAPVTGYLQVSRDALDPVLDYAQHIASFKMGGVEFDGTTRMYENLITFAKAQNGRLEAVAFYKQQLQQPFTKDSLEIARMLM